MELGAILGVIWTLHLLLFLYSEFIAIPAYASPLSLILIMTLFFINPTRRLFFYSGKNNSCIWQCFLFSLILPFARCKKSWNLISSLKTPLLEWGLFKFDWKTFLLNGSCTFLPQLILKNCHLKHRPLFFIPLSGWPLFASGMKMSTFYIFYNHFLWRWTREPFSCSTKHVQLIKMQRSKAVHCDWLNIQ